MLKTRAKTHAERAGQDMDTVEGKEKKVANQHRVTPASVLVPVSIFMPKIAYDAAWNRFSDVPAEFVSDGIESDGLTTDWHATVEAAGGGGIWLNYPWNDPYRWIQKVVAETTRFKTGWGKAEGSGVLVWGPCYPETAAAGLIWDHASRICFWGRRVGHPAPPIDERGNILEDATEFSDGGQGTMWPTWMAYFGNDCRRFEDVFRPYGRVVWGWNTQGEKDVERFVLDDSVELDEEDAQYAAESAAVAI